MFQSFTWRVFRLGFPPARQAEVQGGQPRQGRGALEAGREDQAGDACLGLSHGQTAWKGSGQSNTASSPPCREEESPKDVQCPRNHAEGGCPGLRPSWGN